MKEVVAPSVRSREAAEKIISALIPSVSGVLTVNYAEPCGKDFPFEGYFIELEIPWRWSNPFATRRSSLCFVSNDKKIYVFTKEAAEATKKIENEFEGWTLVHQHA